VFFHFTNSRVWRTTNGGLTFTMIGSATAPNSPGLPAGRVFRSSPYNLGVSPTDLNVIALGAGGGFLDVTTNGGASWTDLNLIALVPGYQGFVTNVTWQDSQTLWITSVAQAPGSARVIKATAAGNNWAAPSFSVMQNGLPDLPVTRVYFDPRDSSRNTIYAATHVGIYSTTDGGANWAPYGKGLPTVRVNDIYMPPDGGFIRIATYGRGIWELPQLELVSAQLSDDRRSCDSDGVLDNGETGRLTVTLKNQGPNNVNHVTLTLTSSNPHVSFPDGNVLNFRPVQKFDESTDSIRVALNGAVGVEWTHLGISIAASELGLPSGLGVVSTQLLNYDEQPAASATESVEATNTNWSVVGDATTSPNINAWQRRNVVVSPPNPPNHVWWGPDNNGQTDGEKTDLPDQQSLVSPTLHVGSGPLILSFQHRFAFEAGNWDGGVVEISTDGGTNWSHFGDGFAGFYNGTTNAVTAAPIGTLRPAFVLRSAGWPNFVPVTLNVGTAYANQDVRIRFRVGADDSTGAPGWDIDNITLSGITDTPFAALVGETAACNP